MTRILLTCLSLFLCLNVFSQNKNLSEYSYVIVPEQFDFLSKKDQYQLNSMTKFYFEKSGFNVYMSHDTPNVNRCDGLYANVEELNSILGTKLQVVLRDCNENEIYRSEEGKSKYKEFDKSYQDALRKTFKSIEALRVKQKAVEVLKQNEASVTDSPKSKPEPSISTPQQVNIDKQGAFLPDIKFANYSNNGKTFLLRKTAEGYSLYEESAAAADGLLLKGKVIVMDKVVKYIDSDGKVSDAAFDASGNLSITDGSSSTIYNFEN